MDLLFTDQWQEKETVGTFLEFNMFVKMLLENDNQFDILLERGMITN